MKKVSIQFPASAKRSCPIFIGADLESALVSQIQKFKPSSVFLFADKHLKGWAARIEEAMEGRVNLLRTFYVPGEEQLKDVRSLYPYYGQLLEARADRKSLILALGGGSVGDAVGFLAATYLRGVDWIGIPSTLLGQVDSGIGGKTGINHETGKNLIGAFHQPRAVFCDFNALKTLPEREWISGLGEIVKYALVFDRKLFLNLEKNWRRVLQRDQAVLSEVVARAIQWKAKVVAQDEHDKKGIREVLNFGHTLGHVLEKILGYGVLRHGEAVLFGMRLATQLSLLKGHLKAEEAERIDNLLAQIPVPSLRARTFKMSQVMQALRRDKKADKGTVRFVLLKNIGRTLSDNAVTESEIKTACGQIGIHCL